ncbi:MAG: mechanosensitive ion channel family protein [bacterium]|nr:mechanosensitive ion channel family protein [bacterium]
MSLMNLFRIQFMGNSVSVYILCFGILLAAGIANRVLNVMVINRLKKVFSKFKNLKLRIVSKTLDSLRGPLSFLLYTIGIVTIVEILNIPQIAKMGAEHILKIAIAVNIAYFLVKAVDIFIEYLAPYVERTESKLDDQLLPILQKVAKIFIWIITVAVILDNMNYDIKSILVSMGIGGVAIALAAKDSISNFFGALTIFIDKPFQIGDRVQIESYDGPIESIGLRSTKIRTLDGTLVIVPNGKVVESIINNIQKRPFIKNMYTISVTYNTSYDKLKKALKILRSVLKNHASTEKSWVYFKEYADYSLNILIMHWCKYTKYQEFLQATEEINLEIKKQFEENQIEFAFPTQSIYLENSEKTKS